MGLGRLNPGCNTCGCVPVPGLEGCDLAHEIMEPISITLNAPVIELSGGLYWGRGGQGEGLPEGGPDSDRCVPGPYIPNHGTITRQLSPQNGCVEYIQDNYGNKQQDNTPTQTTCFLSVLWEFSSIGGCRFAFTNADANTTCYQQSPVGYFSARLSFGVQPGSRATFINVVLQHQIKIVQTFPNNDIFQQCPINFPLFTGVNGNNYTGTGPGQRVDFVETVRPGNRASFAFIQNGFIREGLVNGRPDCGGTTRIAWQEKTMFTQSSYFFYLSDPVYGNQRTFDIWQPNPIIDPWGLFNTPFSATLNLGIG